MGRPGTQIIPAYAGTIKDTELKKDRASQETPEDSESISRILEDLDSHEITEVFDFMGSDNSFEISHYRSEEDEDTQGTQEPFRHPERVANQVKRPKFGPIDDFVTEIGEETEERKKSRWLITTCCYCGEMFRFPSDQPQPYTCENPQCIKKFAERKKKKKVA